jgi:hypothetical protein
MITLDDVPSLRDCGWQPVLAVEDLEVFGGTAEWPPSGRHSSHKRKNEGVDQGIPRQELQYPIPLVCSALP